MNWLERFGKNKWVTRSVLSLAILAMLLILIFGVKERSFRPPILPNTPAANYQQQVVQELQKYGSQLRSVLQNRFTQVQTIRLEWYATALIGIIPLLGFVIFLLFPFYLRRQRETATEFSQISTRQIFKYYTIQAAMAWLVLLTLGTSLWLTQLAVAALGSETNPELVLQQQMTDYIVRDRVILTRRFPDVYSQVAQDLQSLPNEPIIALIMRSGLKVQDDDLLRDEASIIEYSWPTFNDFFLVTLGVVVFFYLRRFWFDVKKMVYYPLRIIKASQRDPALSIWAVGWRVMKTELGVTLVFSLQVLFLAAIMGFAMSRFFALVSSQQVITTSAAMTYMIEKRGDASIAVIAILLELLYLVEAIVLFLIAFSFLVGRVTNAMRARFNHYLTPLETALAIRLQIFHFVWSVFLATVLVAGLLALVGWLSRQYITSDDFSWPLILILPPAVLLLGLNLGMWLLRGFHSIYLLSMDSFQIPLEKLDIL